MKKFYLSCLLVILSSFLYAGVLNFSFSAGSAGAATATPFTNMAEIFFGADDLISNNYDMRGASVPPFTFMFGGVGYTHFQVSTNGWVTFNNGTGYAFCNCDPYQVAEPVNALDTSTIVGPGVAPLWDDLAFNAAAGTEIGYQVTGASPNRVLEIVWNNVNWNNSASPVSPGEISFRVKLYETLNRIDFIYFTTATTGAVHNGSASIGLIGDIPGDYYSLNNTSALPTASKTVNTKTINVKPANNQYYRWDPVALPIELEYFTAQNSGNAVELNWVTASETNNKLFTIERTANEIDWQTVFSEPGAGNSTTPLYYSTMDENPLEGVSYYRLKQIDYDGHFSYSPPAAVNATILGDNAIIEPNPVSNQGTILYKSEIGSTSTITISDCMGRIMKTQSVIAQESTTYLPLDMSRYNNGIYFVTLTTPTRQSTSRCVVLH